MRLYEHWLEDQAGISYEDWLEEHCMEDVYKELDNLYKNIRIIEERLDQLEDILDERHN